MTTSYTSAMPKQTSKSTNWKDLTAFSMAPAQVKLRQHYSTKGVDIDTDIFHFFKLSPPRSLMLSHTHSVSYTYFPTKLSSIGLSTHTHTHIAVVTSYRCSCKQSRHSYLLVSPAAQLSIPAYCCSGKTTSEAAIDTAQCSQPE